MTSSATSRPASAEAAGARPEAAAGLHADVPSGELPIVAIVADDLIWSTRLSEAVTAAGARPSRLRSVEGLAGALPPSGSTGFVLVDLTARAYDGIEAICLASAAGAAVLAVGQHDDQPRRAAALEAGASRVLAYRKLFEDGPEVIRRWLGLG